MKTQVEISIITINYNGLKDTCDLIDSCQKYLTIPCELIVVDNASAIDEASVIQEKYPWTICLRSKKNLGFSGGNNLGLGIARGKYILLINNDAYITDDSIKYLVERLESDASIGGVSPMIRFSFPPQNIQYAGYTPLTPITLRNRPIGYLEEEKGQYRIPRPTAYLHGAAMMIKKEVIQKTGLMPEVYFLYYEELDWCTQMQEQGYILYFEPRCTIFHKESQSTGQASPLRTFYITRNRMLYAYRHRRGITKYLSLGYQVFVALVKNSILFLLKRRPDLVRASLSGAWDFFLLKNKRH